MRKFYTQQFVIHQFIIITAIVITAIIIVKTLIIIMIHEYKIYKIINNFSDLDNHSCCCILTGWLGNFTRSITRCIFIFHLTSSI